MENIKIALITKDKDYGRALGLALVDVYRYFTVTLFKSVPLHNELDQMDLVLSDIEEDYEVGGKNIYLTEKISQIDKNYDERIFSLYKYSNIRELTGELIYIYSMITGRKSVPVRNVNAKIVVFGAVEGGCGCTSAAFTFAHELKRNHNKKIIYVSLEELESTADYMEIDTNGKSISDYLYYLLNHQGDDKYPFLESYTVKDPFGVDAFIPSPGRNVLKSLSAEEIQYFISAVLDTGGYDYMVIDAGTNIAQNVLTCYEMANEIYIITNGSSTCKMPRFIEYILFSKGENVTDRIHEINLPAHPDSFSRQNDIKLISPEGEFSKIISQVVNASVKKI